MNKYAASVVMIKSIAGTWNCPNMLFVVSARTEKHAREIVTKRAKDTHPEHEIQSILIQIVN